MKNNPIYTFEDKDSRGIDTVPLSGLVLIRDYNGTPLLITKIKDTGLLSTTTIDQFLVSGTHYESFITSSELEKLPGSDPAWRILGRDPANYAPGGGSVDFSQSTDPLTPKGAQGSKSFAEGVNTTASGEASHAEGYGTIASGDYSHAGGLNTIASGEASYASGYNTKSSANIDGAAAFGKWNVGTPSAYIFEVGNGTSDITRRNAFEIDACTTAYGVELRAPMTEVADIQNGYALVTKDYLISSISDIALGDLSDVTAVPEAGNIRLYTELTFYSVGDIIDADDGSGVKTYRCITSYTSAAGGTQFEFSAEIINWAPELNNVVQNSLLVYNPVASAMSTGEWENIEDLDMGYY